MDVEGSQISTDSVTDRLIDGWLDVEGSPTTTDSD